MILQRALTGHYLSSAGFIIAILVLINVISFGAFFLDKRKAIQGEWRIPEKILFILAGFGGAAGALFAMKLFRHKTRNIQFSVGIPVLLILQIIVALIAILLFL